MFTLTWTTKKELQGVLENKGNKFRRKKNMEFESGGEKMRNARGQQGKNELIRSISLEAIFIVVPV